MQYASVFTSKAFFVFILCCVSFAYSMQAERPGEKPAYPFSVDKRNNEGQTPLHVAAQEGAFAAAKELVLAGASLAVVDDNGNTPLHVACSAEKLCEPLIGLLLMPSCGAEPDQKNGDGKTALAVLGHKKACSALIMQSFRSLSAARMLYTAVVNKNNKRLDDALRTGAPLDYADQEMCTPLHVAARSGNMGAARKLIKAGALVDLVNAQGQTPLSLAVEAGNDHVVELLLGSVKNRGRASDIGSIGLLVNQRDHEGTTSLHLAVRNNDKVLVQKLLRVGARQDLRGKGKALPVHIAALAGNVAMLELLLADSLGKNIVNSAADKGMTPLAVTLYYNHQQAALMLLNNGADPLVADEKNFTTLMCAVTNKDTIMAQVLLNHVRNRAGEEAVVRFISEKDTPVGFTVLHTAATVGSFECASILTQQGANVNAKSCTQVTPLHIACCAGDEHRELVGMFIAKGADLFAESAFSEEKNITNGAPLHWAAHFGQAETVRLLIENGADMCQKNSEGQTALQLALRNGHVGVVDVIRGLFAERFAVECSK